MRFAAIILLAFASYSAAQTPIPPPETAPTGSVTVPSTQSTSSTRTRTSSGTRSGTASLSGSGTLTASTNGTATASASSVTPTTTTYPSLGDASPCVVNCLQVSIAQANCSTITQVDCYCTSERFRTGLVQCVAATCPDELTNAENLGQQFCDIISVSQTYPAAPTTSSIASSSGSASTSPTTSANAAPAAFKSENGLWTIAALLFGAAAL
ncbi:hypothetical protein BDV93DRAFT_519214 [Ceratobasidium sp. AG-I]|nr:hypothetical protein BDV93DRAFT_519214 [Ceratobasidium sp. AG-I]